MSNLKKRDFLFAKSCLSYNFDNPVPISLIEYKLNMSPRNKAEQE